jgi:hypothetical protein
MTRAEDVVTKPADKEHTVTIEDESLPGGNNSIKEEGDPG